MANTTQAQSIFISGKKNPVTIGDIQTTLDNRKVFHQDVMRNLEDVRFHAKESWQGFSLFLQIGENNPIALSDKAFSDLLDKISYGRKVIDLPIEVASIVEFEVNDPIRKRNQNLKRWYPQTWMQKITPEVDLSKATFRKVFKAISLKTMSAVVNHLILSSDMGKQYLFRISGDGSAITAILADTYQVFGTRELLSEVSSVFDGGWYIEKFTTDTFGNYAELRMNRRDNGGLAKVNDIHMAVHLSTSETGKRSVNLTAGLFQLKCLNGMGNWLNKDADIRLVHNRSSDRIFYDQLETFMVKGNEAFSQMVEGYNESKSLIVPQTAQKLIELAKQAKLSDTVTYHARRLLADQEHMYGTPKGSVASIADTFTELAHRHYDFGSDGYRKLERLGAEVLQNRFELVKV